METTETKKRADKPVQLTIAKLPGRRYEEDKPRDCRYCYYWAGRIRGCSRKKCWYVIPLPEKAKKESEFWNSSFKFGKEEKGSPNSKEKGRSGEKERKKYAGIMNFCTYMRYN